MSHSFILPGGDGKFHICGAHAGEGDTYPIPGDFDTEDQAREAAARYIIEYLEDRQPSSVSGGQRGNQDRVHIIRPDASWYRFVPASALAPANDANPAET